MIEGKTEGVRPAVGYCRVSTDQQNFASQKDKIAEFAKRNGYEISHWFIDEAISGAEEERPQLLALKEWVKNHNGGTVIMSNVDRLARDFYIFAIYSRLFRENSINVLYIATPQSGEPAMDNLIQMILGAFAEFEKNIIKERFMRGKRYKLKSGFSVGGGKAPFGYINADFPEGKKMIINQEEAGTVKKIFNLYCYKKMSIKAIRRYLDTNKVKPSGRFFGKRKTEGWSIDAINFILSNKTYLGKWTFGKSKCIGTRKHDKRLIREVNDPNLISLKVEPLIDMETFDKAQVLRQVRSRTWGFNTGHRRSYLLRGLLACGLCQYCYGGLAGSTLRHNAY
ncbi:MAG: recombinase family protein, partial [Patescibacteria group bacterium]